MNLLKLTVKLRGTLGTTSEYSRENAIQTSKTRKIIYARSCKSSERNLKWYIISFQVTTWFALHLNTGKWWQEKCLCCYSSSVSLGTIKQSSSRKPSAEVGRGDRMHFKMMARWWHSKCPSLKGCTRLLEILLVPYAYHRGLDTYTLLTWNNHLPKHMSAEYLLPNPEGVCDSNIVSINEKNVSRQKLFFLPLLLIKSFKQLITSFYRLESQIKFWIYYFTKTPGVNLSPENYFTWTNWLSCGVSEHTLDGNLK